MILQFYLGWVKSGPASKAFKIPEAGSLFFEYVSRISKFSPCEASAYKEETLREKTGGRIWICHREAGARGLLSSEALAKEINKLQTSSAKKLHIVIGGPDGFTAKDIERIRPDLLWSFGPLTLPHDLAAVVAAEQIYRAWTIQAGLPYHQGH